jgi:hypothetical protein
MSYIYVSIYVSEHEVYLHFFCNDLKLGADLFDVHGRTDSPHAPNTILTEMCVMPDKVHSVNYSVEQSSFEKLTGLQLVKNFPAFYGTQILITAFTGACYLSLS